MNVVVATPHAVLVLRNSAVSSRLSQGVVTRDMCCLSLKDPATIAGPNHPSLCSCTGLVEAFRPYMGAVVSA